MEDSLWVVMTLFILGAMLGSFAVASVWRLRARQLLADKDAGEKLSHSEKNELKRLMPLTKEKVKTDRSRCLSCGHELKYYELVPVVSWIFLRGRCKNCGSFIGWTEVLAEVGLGSLFVISYLAWPYSLGDASAVLFALWCICLTLLLIHIVYDAKWFLLLDSITIAIAIVSVVFVAIRMVLVEVSIADFMLNSAISLMILPGLYWLMYGVSRGGWIGFGDVKLLFPLALMLQAWPYALLMLFLANLYGTLWIVPGLLSKRLTRKSRVPFGPFLIIAWVSVMLFGEPVISYYMGNLAFLN